MIISKQHKKVLIPACPKIQALWPDVGHLEFDGINYAVLPHDARTQIALRPAGIDIPPAILSHYDWEGGEPFEVQKKTCAMMTSNQRGYVLNDMGTGKTKSALWSWRYLNRTGCAGRLLVVAPLSTLKFVWAREVIATLPGIRAVVLHGTKAQRLELLKQNADVFIINHDGLKVIEPELYARRDIDCLCLDESAVYRNNSQRSKRMRVFAARFAWVWAMTGRPMPNLPTDVWGQCKIVTPGTVPQYFRFARSVLMHQVGQYKWIPKSNAIETAFKWMQPSVRFALDDVVELPPFISRVIDVEMTAQQVEKYRRLVNDMAVMIENKMITAANAGVEMGKLLQIGCGFVYDTNPSYAKLDSTPRQETLLELIEEAPQKCLVFAPYRHLIENLSALLTETKIDHAVVHGDIHNRESIFNDFQNTQRYRLLLAHPACVHHGLTLTAATTIIWYSPVTSLEIYEQANARIRRYGQQHKQLFLHLQSSSVERKIYKMLQSKQRLQDAFLSLIKSATKENGDANVNEDEEEPSDQHTDQVSP